MQLFSLLAGEHFTILEEGFVVAESWLSWLTSFIRILIEGVGITGVGIILFTLILKAVTLPFDIYQRISTRKQSLVMRNMQPELDKLQKQYANDKQAYSAKMMELYKKNGYNMFGACLPMIISMIILIFAFQSLNEFSQQANLAVYERMTASYNQAVLQYSISEEEASEIEKRVEVRENGINYVVVQGSGADKFLYFEYNADEKREDGTLVKNYVYKVDTAKMWSYFETQANNPLKAYYDANKATNSDYTQALACVDYLSKEIGGVAAAQSYHDNKPDFLWIQNIWYPDVSYAHPIQGYNEFVNSITAEIQLADGTKAKIGDVIKEDVYNSITSKLNTEKTAPNGYFILIILSIGLMLLSQFLSMRSTKEASKYQKADGSGVGQQKLMLILMPLIYAIFAFLYSAAFSLYMTMSSLIGILVTLGSNFIIDRVFRKKETEAIKQQYNRVPLWMQQNNNKKNKK